MNPHFIFNSLNSIQELVLLEDKSRSYDYIALFSKMVRYILNYSTNDFIPVKKELEFLAIYLSLEKLRFETDFEYTIQYFGSKEVAIPLMLIQPFIENTMRHGLFHKKGLKQIDITFEFTDQLVCIVKDNGIGFEEANRIQQRQKRNNSSAALNAIELRLDLINKKFGKKMGSFSIIDLHEGKLTIGTKVEIILPFKPCKDTLNEKSN